MSLQMLQQNVEEQELVERARRKDPKAIRLLIKQQNQRLYRIARSIVRDDSDAEDVLQEAYVRAFAGLDGFKGEARIGIWLARIVINEALGWLRRRPTTVTSLSSTHIGLVAQIIPFPGANRVADPETSMAQSEIHLLLERSIDGLPQGFREVFVARLVEGMSVQETAELFGIPPQTVKTRLFRARALLRTEIERQIGPVLRDAFAFAGRRCDELTEAVLSRLSLADFFGNPFD
jgi:RNA polymerase sigma-70 factor (ECF subfamily)